MAPRLAFPPLLALVLTALYGSIALPAAGEDQKPGTIVTLAGTGTPGYSGDGGPASEAQLSDPVGLALDARGNLFISEYHNNRVRKVSPDGIITTVAGTSKPGFSGDGGRATSAQLNLPWMLAVDLAGDLLVSDFFNHRVRKVTPDSTISTFAGSGKVDDGTGLPKNGGFSGDNGPATAARFNGPVGLAVNALGDLFILDLYNFRVRKVSPDGTISTVAGVGVNRFSGDGGPATKAGFTYAWGLTVDAAGDLFIAEQGSLDPSVPSHRVRKVTPDGVISTVAGIGKGGFSGDGSKATSARLNSPIGLAVDSAGDLFIADNGNLRVRKVDAVTGIITTVAGNGKQLYAGDGSLATETGIGHPAQLIIDAVGNLLISDYDDGRVFKVFGVAAPGLLAGKAFPW